MGRVGGIFIFVNSLSDLANPLKLLYTFTMTKKRIAINGFGRIGRLTARILLEKYPEVEIIAINDITSGENLAYLFEFDSTYRRFSKLVFVENGELRVEDQTIKIFAEMDPLKLPWGDLQIDVVLECTGHFLTRELANLHIQAGAKKVLLSAPAKSDDIPTVVFGANLDSENIEKYRGESIISNASCTTNCIAPVLKVLSDNFEIEKVFGLTNHAYTATQPLQDGPTKKDFRDGRAGAVNLIPSKTGAAKAIELVLPNLAGRVSLSSLRVPVQTGSMVYIVAQLKGDLHLSTPALNTLFETASKSNLDGVLEYSTSDLVSSDIIGNSHSIIFDSQLTEVMGNTVKLIAWYDNEYGYSSRFAQLTHLI
jgi:glyceraldehyde 3-phosphate dehydrogenase